ncbi:MAG TPA: heavy metal translocating P-type ATPase [Solirubrobacteraceae bacterium]|nr:heavy metal translocating P-type ATPase [Solirubrobacteraceae bacterium]
MIVSAAERRSATPGAAGDTQTPERLQLAVDGMTCGACAARVERVLNRIDGVSAQVNYATERAAVAVAPGVEAERLLHAVDAAGYHARVIDSPLPAAEQEAEQTRRLRTLKHRLIVAAVLFMPICDLSILLSIYPSLRLAGWQWLMVALTAPVVTWAAWPFYAAAIRAARHRTTTMDTLVSLGIIAATGWSIYAIFWLDAGPHAHGSGDIYLDVPAGVTAFLLAGRYFEAWSRRRSGNALRALAEVAARDVTVLDADGVEHRRAAAALTVGDRFVVRPGETIATDGEVVSGSAALDRGAMTGESEPVEVGPGDEVLGGTVSETGRVVVRATRVGRDTQLGRMLALVEQAQNEKAAVQRLADRISGVFVPTVIVIAAATLAAWLLTDGATTDTFNAALSVLIIACPCALGLATPAALFVAMWRAADDGIFFKDYRALEASRSIDTVLLDKTGTLTEGRMALHEVICAAGVDEDELLRLAGAVETASEHPVGRAIAAAAAQRLGALPDVDGFVTLPGTGARGDVDGVEVRIGRVAPGELPAALQRRCAQAAADGRTVVVVHRGVEPIGALSLTDAIRPSAAPAVSELTELGLHCVLVTGDNEATAQAVARAIGIDDVRAGVLPTEKVALIREAQAEGHSVAMVGDGINDAPALACADLGLAIGSGTDAAINAGDLIVLRDDLTTVTAAISLARRTLRIIRENLAWAFVYNLAAIPLAAVGLLDPLIAGGAMALSSCFVVYNSSRLRRTEPAAAVTAEPALARQAAVADAG